MPRRVDNFEIAFEDSGIQRLRSDFEKVHARYTLYCATITRERRDIRVIADAHWDMINATESKLMDLWDTLKKRHPEGVQLGLVLHYLWNSFEGDVRFLCDHVMEDDPVDMASMAHAAGSALIGLRAIITACIRSPDQPFKVDEMLKYITDFAGDLHGNKLNKNTPDPTQAWGDSVSKHG